MFVTGFGKSGVFTLTAFGANCLLTVATFTSFGTSGLFTHLHGFRRERLINRGANQLLLPHTRSSVPRS